uniref:Uncharacterized protein n=1 Tax=Hordeum vulgare subsp. vulgare TaxID=112509 RepID=A0A8I6XX18_HORVV
MWHYTGPEDSTRTIVVGAAEEKVASWVLQITGACENPRGSRRVKPFCADNPPPNQKWTNWFSPVLNGNPTEEEEEGSQEGSVESAEFVSDSGETAEETCEEEEEDEEQDSPPPQLEHRTKRRHEPAVPSVPPASSSAPPTAPVVPSAWSTKRARDVVAEPAGQPSKAAKLSGSKPRKALPRMRVTVPVTSTVATSATSPACKEDDPMDTDNVVSSQPGVICVDEGDQGRPEQAAEPVLEAAPPVTALAEDVLPTEVVLPTETALVADKPTGAGLGMPKEIPTMPGSSNIELNVQRLPEDQVGVAKGGMVQAKLMAGEAKKAYDSIASLYQRSLELRDDIRKTCEMGTSYETLRAEKIQFAGELDAALLAMAGMKEVLAEREKSLEQAREANKVLTEEVEKMGKQRTALMGQMDMLNKRCIAQEKYVSDWARQMITRLADFCIDAEAEAADVERSIRENVPLGEDANRDLLRAHIRMGKVGPFIGRLREVVGRIDKELWPEDESRQEMENLMTQLEEIPNRLQSWKKSAACCGADVALSLVRVHCKEVREEKLKALKVANTKKLRFKDFMETFLESATRIADGIDLDTFVEPSSPGANPDDA